MANWTQEAVRDDEAILAWRREQLVRAGYTDADAARVAARLDVDVHFAVELLERGCEAETALRILL